MNDIWRSRGEDGFADIHCHILPGVDDGAVDIYESEEMLNRAQQNGIRAIVATPHVISREFDFDFAREQYEKLKPKAAERGIDLRLGYEVNVVALADFSRSEFDRLAFTDSDSLLLEFNIYALPPNWIRLIESLQDTGKKVIIAHPERYAFIQKDLSIAEKMVGMGCRLQCDAFVFDLGRFDKQRRTAFRMLDRELISWIATDAHMPSHYDGFKEVIGDFSDELLSKKIIFWGINNGLISKDS